jgi:hypothetical protein
MFGDVIDSGNDIKKIIQVDDDQTMLRTFNHPDAKYANCFSSSWNRFVKFGLSKRLDGLKVYGNNMCAVKGLYTHIFVEGSTGILTTDSNWKTLGSQFINGHQSQRNQPDRQPRQKV